MRDLSRLQELGDILLLISPNQFDMQAHYLPKDSDPAPLTQFDLLFAKIEIVNCALGWAAMYEPFQKQGLSVNMYSGVYNTTGVVFEDQEKDCCYYHEQAARAFFGITQTEVEWIFCSMFYSPSDRYSSLAVVKRIEKLVKNDGMNDEDQKEYDFFYQEMLTDILF